MAGRRRPNNSPDYDRPVFGSGGPAVMPFGKHRGKPLGAVPYSYLVWFCGLDSADPGLRDKAVDEIIRRGRRPARSD